MINVEMTVFEMVTLCSLGINAELQARIIAALEKAVGSSLEKAVGSTGDEQYRFNLLRYNPERKIPVIKEVRMAFNWGLKEAKEWVENADPDVMIWSTTPWMEYNNAHDLRNTLIDLGCACSIPQNPDGTGG